MRELSHDVLKSCVSGGRNSADQLRLREAIWVSHLHVTLTCSRRRNRSDRVRHRDGCIGSCLSLDRREKEPSVPGSWNKK